MYLVKKVNRITIERIGTWNQLATVTFDDNSKFTRILRNKRTSENNDCILNKAYNNKNVESLFNQDLFFDTERNGKYLNIGKNYLKKEVLSEIREIVNSFSTTYYIITDEKYFELLKVLSDYDSNVYKVKNILVTKLGINSVFFREKYNSNEYVNPFNIKKIYETYFKDLKYDNNLLEFSGISIGINREKETETHMRVITSYTYERYIEIGMSIKTAIDISNKIKNGEKIEISRYANTFDLSDPNENNLDSCPF